MDKTLFKGGTLRSHLQIEQKACLKGYLEVHRDLIRKLTMGIIGLLCGFYTGYEYTY